jgi:hypothetical protein
MTTKVIISTPEQNHLDVLVESYNPVTGQLWSNAKRLTDNETMEVYVHGGVALRITEIPKVAKVVDQIVDQTPPV